MDDLDPRLTPPERVALEWLLLSDKKGGAGWCRQSPAGLQVIEILELGETRNERDEALLAHASRRIEMLNTRHDAAIDVGP